jgi:glycosyltransferase involved in cell wall biosynthesis
MKTLVSFATRWGTQFGGINSFNKDLLEAFAAAHHDDVQTVCVVLDASLAEIEDAKNRQIILVSLGYEGSGKFPDNSADEIRQKFERVGHPIDTDLTVWLGHDRITGDVAIRSASLLGGRSALIHHMSYDHYESFAEYSDQADKKVKQQKVLFGEADLLLAIGPLLRDALQDMMDRSDVHMLIPGLPDIQAKNIFRTFRGFVSGRLSEDSRKIKQGHLAIAAFSNAVHNADANEALPEALRGTKEPGLTVRGIDFEQNQSAGELDAETELKSFSERFAKRAIRLHALPFTTNRQDLFDELRGSSVAMMPSWHEGFGLVGWEAIGAGVPVILSKKSGLFRLLEELDCDLYPGLVHPIDVAGSSIAPYFRDEDMEALTRSITEIAKAPNESRRKSLRLREAMLKRYQWIDCARTLSSALGWTDASLTEQKLNWRLDTTQISPPIDNDCALELPRPVWRADSGYSISWPLRAEEAVIPFDSGRIAFLNEQLDWAHSDAHPISIRLLTGIGGTGKTRLAIELCSRLIGEGWNAGFLPHHANARQVADSLGKQSNRTCIIIDYAETRQPQLLELLRRIQESPPNPKTKIVLLARDGGEWWNMLPSKDPVCERLLDGMATTGPYALPILHDTPEVRASAYQRAISAFSDKLGLREHHGTPSLDDDHFAHPLYIQMSALLSLHGEQPGSSEAVARSLLNHEARYWAKAISPFRKSIGQDDNILSTFMTLATLANGFSTLREAEVIWKETTNDSTPLKPIFNTMAQLYPARQGVEGLRPDLLGEALVAQSLVSVGGDHILASVLRSRSASVRRSALTVLSRVLRNREEIAEFVEPVLRTYFVSCADDLIAVAMETPSPLIKIAESAFSNLPDKLKWQAAGILSKYATTEIVPLVDLWCLVNETILDRCNRQSDQTSIGAIAKKANALNMTAVGLFWQGQADKAATRAELALKLYRKVAKADPKRYELDVAKALNNYANRLGDLGRHSEAVDIGRASLELTERLSSENPGRYDSQLAVSLGNSSNRLSKIGLFEEARSESKRSLDIYERLASKNPEKYRADRISALDNYSARLSEVGDSVEAELLAKEAQELCGALAASEPGRYEATWANYLSNYANRLGDLGLVAQAEATCRRAKEIYEKLAKAKPDRFESTWITIAINHADWLRDLGLYEESYRASSATILTIERLDSANPQRFRYLAGGYLYARTLLDLDSGDLPAALQNSQRAADLYGELAKDMPLMFHNMHISALRSYHLSRWILGLEPLRFSYPDYHASSERQERGNLYTDAFFVAFSNLSDDLRTQGILNAEKQWLAMDASHRRHNESTTILLASLAELRGVSCSFTADWRIKLNNFRLQRNGRIPAWMSKIALISGGSF